MSNTYCQLHYHLVWSTKDRQPIIDNEFKENLYKYLAGGVKGEGGQLIEIGGVCDHVHLLVTLSPHYPVAKLVQKIKISSSKWVSQNIPRRHYYSWQEGYGAFSVSASNKAKVVQYIKNQEQHHLETIVSR